MDEKMDDNIQCLIYFNYSKSKSGYVCDGVRTCQM